MLNHDFQVVGVTSAQQQRERAVYDCVLWPSVKKCDRQAAIDDLQLCFYHTNLCPLFAGIVRQELYRRIRSDQSQLVFEGQGAVPEVHDSSAEKKLKQ